MFNICFHCWHGVKGTRRKIKLKNSCRQRNPYISKDNYVYYIMLEECCKCNKKRKSPIYRDCDIDRALEFPSLEDEPLL
jgi:hypothetical protein